MLGNHVQVLASFEQLNLAKRLFVCDGQARSTQAPSPDTFERHEDLYRALLRWDFVVLDAPISAERVMFTLNSNMVMCIFDIYIYLFIYI